MYDIEGMGLGILGLSFPGLDWAGNGYIVPVAALALAAILCNTGHFGRRGGASQ